MTTQLAVYNRALLALGERRLASTAEQREPRRVLDDLYPDCVQYCLEQGMWNFALISATIFSTTGPALNFQYGFAKPADLIHLFAASTSATFDPPLMGTDFIDQGALWYAAGTPLQVRYTSNSASFGANLALWTQSFTTYFVHVLAAWAAVRVTGAETVAQAMEQRASRYLISALAIDSVPQLPGLRPFNSESRSKVVEGFTPQPIDVRPFHAPFMSNQPAPSGQQG